ncbi:Sau3AI family type II restriction endonuclease [Clostridium merdae]|uniref:Sau3AI family type II restriction endonuclease n=1 Tax=Clostridium merdae TaxID=1958780 RepID=UPI000A26C031|nr:Sau3AI family type II restriction endonuclease [Clostridium merdae]
MENRLYKTKEEVLMRGREVIGIPLKQIDITNRLETGKGAVGSVLEESWFGYSINSESEPDFVEAGVELKVTPYIKSAKKIRAKERLVCNIINYMEEYKHTFDTSSFWKKCNTMLLMSYEYRKDVPKGDFTINKVTLFSFPEEDLLIIKQDWKTIVDKIIAGRAHELSESDTLYLGACTKGATAASVRKQPFSQLLAKQRAFSLKQSYMTYILNSYIFGRKVDEHIIKDSSVLKEVSFEQYIINKISPYFGKTREALLLEFNLATTAKNVNALLLARMLGLTGRLSSTEEFKKANILPKTICVTAKGIVKESMSFPVFDFRKIITEKWETCELKLLFESTKFLFVVFQYNSNQELVFDNLLFWNMPEKDLKEVEVVWKRTVEILNKGVEFHTVGKKVYNNLPKASENQVAHVRPHSRNANDTSLLPDGRTMTKQCFWLNKKYIQKQIK